MDDNQIVELYLNRNEDAIARTAEKYGPRLRRIAHGLLNDWQSAEECENDTYLEAWNKIPPHEPRTYLFMFLGRIMRSVALDRYRAESRRKKGMEQCELTKELLECIPSKETVESTIESDELTRVIERFLYNCTLEQKRVFVCRYWLCETIPQIGKRYGMAQGTVKTILFRMRKALRKKLYSEGFFV